MLELDKEKLQKAYDLAKKELYEEAISICDEFIAKYPIDRDGYKERASIFAMMEQHQKAVNDLDISISLITDEDDGKQIVADYYLRGRSNLEAGNLESAIKDFDKVISIEKKENSGRFFSLSYFFRGITHLVYKKYKQSLDDFQKLDDGFKYYIMGRIHTKKDVIDLAQAGLQGKEIIIKSL